MIRRSCGSAGHRHFVVGRKISAGISGRSLTLARLQTLNADILGITVGSVEHFEAMNAFIGERRIAPVIDRVFPFEDAAGAYAYLRSARHFDKVVVRV